MYDNHVYISFKDKEKKEQVFIFIVCEQQLLGQVFEYFKLVFAYMLMGYYLGRQSKGIATYFEWAI